MGTKAGGGDSVQCAAKRLAREEEARGKGQEQMAAGMSKATEQKAAGWPFPKMHPKMEALIRGGGEHLMHPL